MIDPSSPTKKDRTCENNCRNACHSECGECIVRMIVGREDPFASRSILQVLTCCFPEQVEKVNRACPRSGEVHRHLIIDWAVGAGQNQ